MGNRVNRRIYATRRKRSSALKMFAPGGITPDGIGGMDPRSRSTNWRERIFGRSRGQKEKVHTMPPPYLDPGTNEGGRRSAPSYHITRA